MTYPFDREALEKLAIIYGWKIVAWGPVDDLGTVMLERSSKGPFLHVKINASTDQWIEDFKNADRLR